MNTLLIERVDEQTSRLKGIAACDLDMVVEDIANGNATKATVSCGRILVTIEDVIRQLRKIAREEA